MKKKTSLLLLLLLISISSETAAKQKQTVEELAPALAVIDTWLEAQRDYDMLPGISAAIVQDQVIIWSKGYGMADLDTKYPATDETIYSICSISKLFTSVAIMKLRDAGKLQLEDRVADLLPWFDLKQQWEDSGPITVRSLLTHSSGLPRESAYPYWTGPDFPFPTSEQLKSKLGSQKTLYPASTYFQYSNLGLSLLGEIIAEVSGLPYAEYIRQHILEKLKLNDTHPSLPESIWGRQLASGYSAKKRDGSRDKVALFQADGIAPAAGFSSSVLDLARFASWQFRLLQKGGKEILKSATLREMHRVHWLDPDWETTWGLGFSVSNYKGRTIVGHGGSCPGYRSTLTIDLEKQLAFTVMINAQNVSPGKYANGMRDLLFKAMETKKDEQTKVPDLTDYCGTYNAQPWGGETVILPWYGKLVILSLPSDNPARSLTVLKYEKKDTFRRIRKDKKLGEEILFERDVDGKVIRFWQHSNFRNKLK